VLVSFFPLFGLIMLVLGTILAGIATPAEAAAAGAFGAIVLSYFPLEICKDTFFPISFNLDCLNYKQQISFYYSLLCLF